LDALCPLCGYLNRRLLPEETGGRMECARCLQDVYIPLPEQEAETVGLSWPQSAGKHLTKHSCFG